MKKLRHIVVHPNTKNEALCGDRTTPRMGLWKFVRRFWPYGDITRPLCMTCMFRALQRWVTQREAELGVTR